MTQCNYFENGGFVIHKITLPGSCCKFSAWFSPEGKLLDAERINSLGRSLHVNHAQRDALKRIGARRA